MEKDFVVFSKKSAFMLAQKVKEAAGYLKNQSNHAKIALVLGSGLSALTSEVSHAKEISYEEIPHFPKSTVPGHQGKLLFGELEDVPLIILAGRFHYYEGYNLQEVTFPIRVLAELGVKAVILTNAAGALDSNFRAGDIMVIQDHLNFIPGNPLRGIPDKAFGNRFVSLTHAYDLTLRKMALACGKNLKMRIHEGVYVALSGPSYETNAEVKLYRSFGGSAVGMSTAPEVIVARQHKLLVLALSLITNVHREGDSPSHEEVLETAKIYEEKFKNLLKSMVKKIPV